MILRFDDDLDLNVIAESGQCFRWEKIKNKSGPDIFRIIAGNRVLFICELSRGEYDLSCSENDFRSFWSGYFDCETVYREIRETVDPSDPFLSPAAEYGKGMRILRQEPFECLISFIISQRKNIPAIRACIEKLSSAAGERLDPSEDERKWLMERRVEKRFFEELYAFPTPPALATLGSDILKSCSAGYRAPYIRKAAEDVLSGELDLKGLEGKDDQELINELMKIYGVGKKVANCAALFGFHRLDLFPIDVWIERVLSSHYEKGFPFDSYRPYNGVMQQYMFFYARSPV